MHETTDYVSEITSIFSFSSFKKLERQLSAQFHGQSSTEIVELVQALAPSSYERKQCVLLILAFKPAHKSVGS